MSSALPSLALALAISALLQPQSASAAVDVAPLWDFNHPDASEQRFRAALTTAQGDDALILQTQIARTYGLRKDFDTARTILSALRDAARTASPEVQTRFALEWGRSFASATHPPETQTAETRATAKASYKQALAIAEQAHLDALAIDAIHMLAFVDTAPSDQLKWAQQALAVALASSQPDARKWEASLRNNVGYALHELGRYDEALDQFHQALALREQGTDAEATRIARWMVAWTLHAQGHLDEALALQLRLEQECDAARAPDPEVYAELVILYRARGDEARAQHYATLKAALPE